MLINREPLRHMTFDVELLGDCDVIISELCQRLGGTWSSLLDDFEIPLVNRGFSSPEKVNTTVEGQPGVQTEGSERLENDQVKNPLKISNKQINSFIKKIWC